MRSHIYQLTFKDVVEMCLPPLLIVLVCAVGMHLGKMFNLLPPPRPLHDVDRTIILHQVDASRQSHDAQLVLIGDSSCLMSVDPINVTAALGLPTINLGTLSFLDIASYARLLEQYIEHNPGKVRAVVLLCHPEALRRHGPKSYYVEFFESAMAEQDFLQINQPYEYALRLFGLDLVRDRLQARFLPTPLPNEYGQFYGFATDLYNFMENHRGSAVDPGLKVYRGDGRYYLAAHQQKVSRIFRDAIPPGVKLVIGLTPSPKSFMESAYPQSLEGILKLWGESIQADAILSGLPPSFPDHLCASVTHLTPQGRAAYTDALVDQLRQVLPPLLSHSERSQGAGVRGQ